jgi:probable phosphoglycerate mutase
VLSSPLGRARETARLAGFPDVECDDDLTEWDYGSYEGLTTPQIVAQLGHPWSVFQDGAPAGETPGESPDEVTARVKRVFDRVLPSLERGERVLLFSHGHFLRAMASTWLGLSASGGRLLALDTSAVSSLGFEHGTPVIVGWNRVPGR